MSTRRRALHLRWLAARRAVATAAWRVLMRIVPTAPVALVAGLPDTEENSLVTAVRVAQRSRGSVVLVAGDPARGRAALDRVATALGAEPAATRVRVVAKRAPRTAWLFVRAELVLYTHGLFDSPRPVGRRLHVNLWHGTGPKWSGNANVSQRIGAQVLSTASPIWGSATARALSMRDATLVPGNARQDLLGTGPRDVAGLLGLDPGRPLVLWMPTFRRAERAGSVGLSEGADLADDELAGDLPSLAAAAGVQLVVKPHRSDSARYEALGLAVLDDATIAAAGVTLTQVMGAAHGMLSDYSSAWVDFFATGAPIALYCPDLDAYVRDRGLNDPPLGQVAAGLMLRTGGDAQAFFASVAEGAQYAPAARDALLHALAMDIGPGRADRMLDGVRDAALARLGTDVHLEPSADAQDRQATSS
ncbi:CDP-glycerol glycerophosphotransferase family protein [Cellulomonas rhizosphaerae]|uniref:Uncharacterized protein n=1 Tax=Cellulomonas rhizosphaerae TaxID=2293719 RepID=A0A413RJN8_9CELL|nr:CDP-glycerol glycerophosphotransferase family protein [Cellulomonas rhizosphaerae]RHA38893.1 hypothetical protein D1825_12805 [Cellulomonas rhizosphaerae]